MRTLHISQKTIDQTTKCNFEKKCLENENFPLCDVERVSESGVLFVDKIAAGECNHIYGFGFSHICVCPVRKEISCKYCK